MAAVPGILHIAGWHGHGGKPSLQARFSLTVPNPLDAFNDPQLKQCVPCNADGSEMASPTFTPYYDGVAGTEYQVASSTNNTVTFTGSPGFTTNAHVNRAASPVQLVMDIATVRTITANTANQLTVGTNWAVNPAPGSFVRVGTGRFLSYQATYGLLGVLTAGFGLNAGSAWQTLGQGVGADVVAVRDFHKRVYTGTPYFYYGKFCGTGALGATWGTGQSERVVLEAELARMAAAAALQGNTIAWKTLVLDLSSEDIRLAPTYLASYQTNLAAFITALKGAGLLNNSGLFVELVTHHPNLYIQSVPGAAFVVRGIHQEYARTNAATTKIIDMAAERFAQPNETVGSPNEQGDPAYYITTAYHNQGRRIVDNHIFLTNGVSGSAAVGLPVYLDLGDSICVGGLTAQLITELNSRQLLGDGPGTVRPARQRIYNRGSGIVTYDPLTTSNTSGSITNTAGPDITKTSELDKIHGINGYLYIKRGSNGSSLTTTAFAYDPGTGANGRWEQSANQHFQELVTDVKNAYALIVQAGFIPDLRGIFVTLGDNDTVPNGGADFAAALPQFVAELRGAVSTRTSGPSVPIAWRRPWLNPSFGIPAERQMIRDAIQAMAQTDPRFRWYDVDDLEKARSDGIHETPESILISGKRAVNCIQQIAI